MVEQGTHKPLAGGSNPPSATSPPLRRSSGGRRRRAAPAPSRSPTTPCSSWPSPAVADSMALLHGAARLVETDARQWRLTVAHLDHGLRPDSADDATFVADAAAAPGLPSRRGGPMSARWRQPRAGRSRMPGARRATGSSRRSRRGGALIATAHTADDAAETVLLNLLRGSGLAGVRGIPARRGRIVRPLLGARRATLRDAPRRGRHRLPARPVQRRSGIPPQPRARRAPAAARGAATRRSRSHRHASRASPPTTTRCSTRWRRPSWHDGEPRPARSTGTTHPPHALGAARPAPRDRRSGAVRRARRGAARGRGRGSRRRHDRAGRRHESHRSGSGGSGSS